MQLLGINFYQGKYETLFAELQKVIEGDTATLLVTPNPEILYDAQRDPDLLHILQKSDYALPDGVGIFVAYQMQASHLPQLLKYFLFPFWCLRAIVHDRGLEKKYGQRITGAQLTHDLFLYAENAGIPVIILDPVVSGNSPGDIAKRKSQASMQNILREIHPGIDCEIIVADFAEEISQRIKLMKPIKRIKPLLFATHGGGKQEKILAEVMKNTDKVSLALGVGGSIDLLTGFRSPAPAIFRRLGCEWLYRLIKHPRKHWKRMKKVLNFLISV